eukprot:CAMPEP_0174870326 /NCGR_PEP_ID=MMETSP1114-20130205/69527_1 /TAXON_ID=312471 /ORGANISM="Neobodo designis, Strain CCAP 1951/1" /LENGTH=43 /DNA_ID= /DNA_START= /DNA_END= /DNA_ORIENTATION=
MASDAQWQQELERDRQRAQSGQSIDNPRAASHRGTAVDADMAE